MKKILWVSRHSMTSEQIADLNRIYGETEIIQYDKTVTDINEIMGFSVDVYAVVFPVGFIAELMKITSKEVIQPVSERIQTGQMIFNKATSRYEKEYIYKHLCWQKIDRCIIELKRL